MLTWRTSHFHHPRNRTDIVGQVGGRFDMHGGAASPGVQLQPEGVGLGVPDPVRDGKWMTGGLGVDGMVDGGRKDAMCHEEMDTADRTKGRKIIGAVKSETAWQDMAAVQAAVPEEVYSVFSSARSSIQKLQERAKQGTAKLRERYQKRQKQTASTMVLKETRRRQQPGDQRGTRRCDKDDVLTMQAQNHYLLDSYDKNGRYSMLGK